MTPLWRKRAQLNQKLEMLGRICFETARGLSCVAGTSGDYNHIFKPVLHSERMLRPMLCRGPLEADRGATLLCGAVGGGAPRFMTGLIFAAAVM